MGTPVVIIAIVVLAVVLVVVQKLRRGTSGPRHGRRSTAGGAAGAIIAVIVAATASLRDRDPGGDAASGAVTDSLAVMANEKARGTSLAVLLAVGAIILAIGVAMFIRKQNTRS